MKSTILILILSIVSFSACQTATTENAVQTSKNAIRRETVQTPAKDNPTIDPNDLDERTEKALLEALADERKAQAAYEAVIEKFGNQRPFSNIVNAEKRHESFLLPLFEKYQVKVPENEFSKKKSEVLETLTKACQNALMGEKANIAMYNNFLEFVKETDIRQTFTYLRDASENNHLPAFERCDGSGQRTRQ